MNKVGLCEDQESNRRVQIMTTTHLTLSTQRASTIAGAAGRSTMFFTSVSMSLLALGFIAQATVMSAAFYVFAFVLLACLAVIGLFTLNRVVQTSVEDAPLARDDRLVRSFLCRHRSGIGPLVRPSHGKARSHGAHFGRLGRANHSHGSDNSRYREHCNHRCDGRTGRDSRTVV